MNRTGTGKYLEPRAQVSRQLATTIPAFAACNAKRRIRKLQASCVDSSMCIKRAAPQHTRRGASRACRLGDANAPWCLLTVAGKPHRFWDASATCSKVLGTGRPYCSKATCTRRINSNTLLSNAYSHNIFFILRHCDPYLVLSVASTRHHFVTWRLAWQKGNTSHYFTWMLFTKITLTLSLPHLEVSHTDLRPSLSFPLLEGAKTTEHIAPSICPSKRKSVSCCISCSRFYLHHLSIWLFSFLKTVAKNGLDSNPWYK